MANMKISIPAMDFKMEATGSEEFVGAATEKAIEFATHMQYRKAWEMATELGEKFAHSLEECIEAYCPDEENQGKCDDMVSDLKNLIHRLYDMGPVYPEDEADNDYNQEHCN